MNTEATDHLQPKTSTDVALADLGGDELAVHVKVDGDIAAVLVAQLGLDVVELGRGGVLDVLGRDLGAGVERVERDVARA